MKKLLVAIALVCGMLGAGGLAVQPVLADPAADICNDPEFKKEEYKDIYEAAGCKLDDNSTVLPVVTNIIASVLAMFGVIAVVVLIYGGISYVISTGDATKVNKAKHIIMYALIGLVVSMLAYTIVTFVAQNV